MELCEINRNKQKKKNTKRDTKPVIPNYKDIFQKVLRLIKTTTETNYAPSKKKKKIVKKRNPII